MNRYLLRSLVAVSTFLLSIAVSAIIHPFGSRHREYRYSNCIYHERHCPRAMSFGSSSLSFESVTTDPVKLMYSQTGPQPNSGPQQIKLLLANQTTKAINTVVVQYSSRWPAHGSWDVESVRIPYDPTMSVDGLQTVSIDCGSNQDLWVWISTVEFKDESRWVNPRHSGEQSLEFKSDQ